MYTVDSITTPFTPYYRLYSASASKVAEVQKYLTILKASYGLEKRTPLKKKEDFEPIARIKGGLPPLIIARSIKWTIEQDNPYYYYAVSGLLTHGFLVRASHALLGGLKNAVLDTDYTIIKNKEASDACWDAGQQLLHIIDKILEGKK